MTIEQPSTLNEEGLHLVDASLSFGHGTSETPVLDQLSLSVGKQEIVGFFGPNGCGKSTILNVIAGQVSLKAGAIRWRGQTERLPKVGFVFQAYAQSLMPWLNCIENIAFPLIPSMLSRQARKEVTEQFCSSLDIDLPLNNYPHQMSGGQKQLAAILRALISEPELMLLDEPLASLDYLNRIAALEKIQELWIRKPVSTLLVSHDIDEALFLCDRIYVLSPRPAKIVDTIIVDAPRPRRYSEISSSEFGILRSRILAHFAKGAP